ncbi:SIMPL domain-containing protein [Pontibacter sp. H259]|uniref:SIMPL domain-containing protein n=1 Tax=Pontibacter sp. H259 TaxID=3133421 RepID=UPI0030C61D08
MKNILSLLIATLLVSCQTDSTLTPGKFKTIMVKSVGEVETLPDVATFHINLNCLQKSVKASKQCLVDKSNELNKKLLSFGIKQEDILTNAVNMNKSYSWRNNTQVFEGYNSSTTIFVTLRDINKLDQIYTELLENRNLDLGGLAYSHSKLDSLKNEAYVDALKKANTLADKLLAELPSSEKEILKIGNVEISASMPETNQQMEQDGYAVAEVVAPQNRAISISKGTVLINATLFVEYQIK